MVNSQVNQGARGKRINPSGIALANGYKLKGVILDEVGCYVSFFQIWDPYNKKVVTIKPNLISKFAIKSEYLDESGRLRPQNVRAFIKKNGFKDFYVGMIFGTDETNGQTKKTIKRFCGSGEILERTRRNKRGEGDLMYRIKVTLADGDGNPKTRNGKPVTETFDITADGAYAFPLDFEGVSVKHTEVFSRAGEHIANYNLASKQGSNVNVSYDLDENGNCVGDIPVHIIDKEVFKSAKDLFIEHGINILSDSEKKQQIDFDMVESDALFVFDDDQVETEETTIVEEDTNNVEVVEEETVALPTAEPLFDTTLGVEEVVADDDADTTVSSVPAITIFGNTTVTLVGDDLTGAENCVPIALQQVASEEDQKIIAEAFKEWNELTEQLAKVEKEIEKGTPFTYHHATIDNTLPEMNSSGYQPLVSENREKRKAHIVYSGNGISLKVNKQFEVRPIGADNGVRLPVATSMDSRTYTILKLSGEYGASEGFGIHGESVSITSSEIFEKMVSIQNKLKKIDRTTLLLGVKETGGECSYADTILQEQGKLYRDGVKAGTIQPNSMKAGDIYKAALEQHPELQAQHPIMQGLAQMVNEDGHLIEKEVEKDNTKKPSSKMEVVILYDDARLQQVANQQGLTPKFNSGSNAVSINAYKNFLFWLLGVLEQYDGTSLGGFVPEAPEIWNEGPDTGKSANSVRKYTINIGKLGNTDDGIAGEIKVTRPKNVAPGGKALGE